MLQTQNNDNNKFILAIHSTNDFFGFGFKDLNNYTVADNFSIKKLDKDLSRNLISTLAEFLNKERFDSIARISISIGPANFNASRQIVVCARAISQQLNISLDKYSSFKIMAKRIAIKNEILKNNQHFWIIKKLKNRGYIAGKYRINNLKNMNSNLYIEEVISPKLYKKFIKKEAYFEANYDIKDELKQLLELSLKNHENLIENHWKNVLPIYPIEPVN
tara:strand:- start:952 stop:1608 length:657 start_codon:yes stop_codon:yes gene_type:complete